MIVYTQPKCRNCTKIKDKLTSMGIHYEECDNVPLMIEKGFKSTPMIELDSGDTLDYYKMQKWIQAQEDNA